MHKRFKKKSSLIFLKGMKLLEVFDFEPKKSFSIPKIFDPAVAVGAAKMATTRARRVEISSSCKHMPYPACKWRGRSQYAGPAAIEPLCGNDQHCSDA